jgi:hypothetical protein
MNKLIENSTEFGLIDFIQFFILNKLSIVIGTCACGVLGLIYGLIFPQKYEVTAYVSLATVGGQVIESSQTVRENLKLKNYLSAETLMTCNTDQVVNYRSKAVKNLSSQLNKNLPLILTLSFHHSSKQAAIQCLDAVIADIIRHQKIFTDPMIKQKYDYLATLKGELVLIEQVEKLLLTNKYEPPSNGEKLLIMSLTSALQLKRNSDLWTLRNQILEIEFF